MDPLPCVKLYDCLSIIDIYTHRQFISFFNCTYLHSNQSVLDVILSLERLTIMIIIILNSSFIFFYSTLSPLIWSRVSLQITTSCNAISSGTVCFGRYYSLCLNMIILLRKAVWKLRRKVISR